jgi:hypothetical protein
MYKKKYLRNLAVKSKKDLHQSQEALECYWLELTDVRLELCELKNRLEIIKNEYPYLIFYEDIKTSILENNITECILSNIFLGNRFLPFISFNIEYSSELVKLVISSSNASAFFKYFGRYQTDSSDFLFILTTEKDLNSVDLVNYVLLSTTDWNCLLEILNILDRKIRRTASLSDSLSDINYDSLKRSFSVFFNKLNDLPPILRFDDITILDEQISSEYEFICIRLNNLSYDRSTANNIEFRLSCSDLNNSDFGIMINLEFPKERSSASFEKWVTNARDGYGDKLEVRFKYPYDVDIEVLNSLSLRDRDFVLALISQLFYIFEYLNSHKEPKQIDELIKLKRPIWAWKSVADNINLILDRITFN